MGSFLIANISLKTISNLRSLSSTRRGFTAGRIIYNKPSTPQQSFAPKISSAKGLSSKVIRSATEPVGPGASKSSNYKNPEYYCYDRNSFFEAEVEMVSYRCPQPSSKKK